MSNKDHAKAAADHLVCLYTFGAVQAILEGGQLPGGNAISTAQKIIKLCKDEQQRQLRSHDRHIAAIKADQGGAGAGKDGEVGR